MSSEASAAVTRGARALQTVAVLALVAWALAALLSALDAIDAPVGSLDVTLGLYGFVLTFAFGKAYALVPSYFDRSLASSRAPTVHAALAAVGVAGLAAGELGAPDPVALAGALAWAAGVALFVGTLVATVRDNLTGAETGTGDHAAERQPADRIANLAVPAVLLYLLAGTLALVARHLDVAVPGVVGRAGASHLLAAGGAALLIVGVGFRLLPRLLVVAVDRRVVALVVLTGALGPGLLAVSLYRDPWFAVAAATEATAVVVFAATFLRLFARSDRRRVGFYAVGAGAVAGTLGVALGVHTAVVGVEPGWLVAHRRLNLLGFLGLTVVGVALTLYPPSAGRFPAAGDRTAWLAVGGIAGGLAAEVVGHFADLAPAVVAGRALSLVGALAFAWLLVGLFVQRSAWL